MNLSLIAQDSIRIVQPIQEFGISFQSPDKLGILYRFGNRQVVTELGVNMYSQKELDEDTELENTNSNLGFNLGLEGRHELAPNFEFRFGAGFSYDVDKQTQSLSKNLDSAIVKKDYGVEFKFGFNYLVNKNLVLGAAVLPFITKTELEVRETSTTEIETRTYPFTSSERTTTSTNISSSQYGWRPNLIKLTLVYRLSGKTKQKMPVSRPSPERRTGPLRAR